MLVAKSLGKKMHLSWLHFLKEGGVTAKPLTSNVTTTILRGEKLPEKMFYFNQFGNAKVWNYQTQTQSISMYRYLAEKY